MTQNAAHIDSHQGQWDLDGRSNHAQLDHHQPSPNSAPPPLPRARADTLCEALARIDLDTLSEHHLPLAMTVNELASEGGSALSWSHDDPTVVLLRAAAKLAIAVPDSTSSAGFDLINQLQG